ncbi:hypothetical protein NMY22_g5594 [Coprinellus aureogranulatus]|nr:hypothetical protein NMY22_g5594 [Coprinellus aureogranulatus]
MSSPDTPLHDPSLGTTFFPDEIVATGDVQIVFDTMNSASPAADIYGGSYQDLPAQLTEKRQLTRQTEAGVDVRDALVAEARLRREYYTEKHVRVAGIYRTGDAFGSRIYLVEAPYQYTKLKEYLAVHPEVNRLDLFKEALKIVEDLHHKGLVLGPIRPQDFVVDISGSLFLSGFEHMRIEDPSAPFRPILGPSVAAMAYMAPELLRSFKDDGEANLTKAADVYALGCFAYELFTGQQPFAEYVGDRTHRAQYRLISAVVDRNERPQKPAGGSDSFIRFGLTEGIWGAIASCWHGDSASRPSVADLLFGMEGLVISCFTY